MSIIDVIRAEWPSIVMACVIALPSGFLFGVTHDLYKKIVSPWLARTFSRLQGRS